VSFADGKVEAQWRREGKGVRRRKESMSTERSPAEKVRGGHRRQTGVHVRGKEEGKKDGRSLDWGKVGGRKCRTSPGYGIWNSGDKNSGC
jgi:hypothetical protein